MNKIKIGDTLNTKHGISVITGIEVVAPGQSDGGTEVEWIYEFDKDRCVFDLANGHWAYGHEVTVIRSTPETTF